MGIQDVTNILGILFNLVSNDRSIDQESTAVRDFKAATTKLIARLEAAPSDAAPGIALSHKRQASADTLNRLDRV